MCHPGRPGPQGLAHCGSSGLARFPQREIERAALLLADFDAGPGPQIVGALAGEAAVGGELTDRVIDVALGGIGELPLLEPLDDVDDLADVLGGAGLDVGRANVEGPQVGFHLFRVVAGDLGRRALFRQGRGG